MTIKTMIHIHELLKEEVKVKEEAVKVLRKKLAEAENSLADNVPDIENLKDKALHELWESEAVLSDFESQEWHG